jgi:tripartite ATP-independent transporter DctP family solute receptor
LQKYIDEHSDNLEVKLYPSSALGQEREVYEAMQLGSGASCVISGSAILNNFVPKTGVLDLPFLWHDFDHAHRVLDSEVGDLLAKELEDVGIKILAWIDSWGYRNVVTSDKEVKTADDLKGMKIRTIQSPFNIAALNSMGTNATPMAFGEIYTSMQTGVLDGFEHSAAIIRANKFYEVAKYLVLTRHLFGPVVISFSKKEWDSLLPEDQKVVQEAALLARDIERALAPVREREAIAALQQEGMIVNEIDRTPFLGPARSLQRELAKEYGFEDLLEKIWEAAKVE